MSDIKSIKPVKSKRDQRNLQNGEFYHIFNRGNHLENIALDEEDYIAYSIFLFEACEKYFLELIGYCFMPNHVHLLVRIIDVKKFILCIKVFTARSAKYYNKKYKVVGHIFQDKYKHRLIESNDDLLSVCNYIHRNPLTLEGMTLDNLKDYPWSSFPVYAGLEKNDQIVTKYIKNMFSSQAKYRDFVLDIP